MRSVTLLLRNSETLWFDCPARLANDRDGQGEGRCFLTSLRVVFTDLRNPFELSVAAINFVNYSNAHELQIVGKSSSTTQTLRVADPVVAAHLRRIVQVCHRQVDVGFEEQGRNIPQDVKAVVWQRDGGRCVDCGAGDYLEFGHIIPFSKGGANTVDNLQIRCRRCNLRKGANK